MTTKKAKNVKAGDIISGYDVVTNVVRRGVAVELYTLCYIHGMEANAPVEVGSNFRAWYPDARDAATEYAADSWAAAKAEAIERLECKEVGYVGEIIVQNAFNNERKTYRV